MCGSLVVALGVVKQPLAEEAPASHTLLYPLDPGMAKVGMEEGSMRSPSLQFHNHTQQQLVRLTGTVRWRVVAIRNDHLRAVRKHQRRSHWLWRRFMGDLRLDCDPVLGVFFTTGGESSPSPADGALTSSRPTSVASCCAWPAWSPPRPPPHRHRRDLVAFIGRRCRPWGVRLEAR